MGSISPYPTASSTFTPSNTLAYAQITTGQTAIGTGPTDITGLSISVVVPEGRRVRLSAYGVVDKQTSTSFVWMRIMEGGAYVASSLTTVGTAEYGMLMPTTVLTPSAGTHTYRVSVYCGANTVNLLANPEYPAFIMAEDITGQPVAVPPASVPIGVLGYAVKTTTQGGIGAAWTVISGLTVNVVVPAGRTLRATAHSHMQNTVVGGAGLSIAMDGAGLGEGYGYSTAAGSGTEVATTAMVSPAAGSHTFTVSGYALNSGTVTQHASSAIPAHLVIEDITPTPAPASSAPSSTLAYLQNTTGDQALSGSTETAITGLGATITVPAGRRLKITVTGNVHSSVVDDVVDIRVKEDGVQLGLVEVCRLTGSGSQSYTLEAIRSPAAGTHTYTATAQRVNGTGTVTHRGNSSALSHILVEDITGASLLPTAIVPGAVVCTAATRPSSPTVGTEIYETDTKLQRVWTGSDWRVDGQIRSLNSASQLFGSAPSPETSAHFLQWGSNVVSTDGVGDFTITFATPFPNGVGPVFVQQGDNTHGGATYIPYIGGMTLSLVKVRVYNASGAAWASSGSMRVTWMAMGW